MGGTLRKKRKEEEEIIPDFNPAYATYEVHDDPVAEVMTGSKFQRESIRHIFQVILTYIILMWVQFQIQKI